MTFGQSGHGARLCMTVQGPQCCTIHFHTNVGVCKHAGCDSQFVPAQNHWLTQTLFVWQDAVMVCLKKTTIDASWMLVSIMLQ